MTRPAWTIRRPLIVFLVLLNLVFLGVIFRLGSQALRVRAVPASKAGLPVLASVSPFELIRESGEPFSSETLKGRPWLASFIFTRCGGACPLMSSRFAVLQRTLPAHTRLVSFTVDAAYDSPDVLKKYAAGYGAESGRWIFLTGDPAIIRQVQTDLKLSNSDDPSMHSLRFVLIDREGNVRGYYDSQDTTALEKLTKDIKLMEKP